MSKPTQNPGPEMAKALSLCAQLDALQADLRAVQAEQVAAKQRREQLAASLEQLRQIEAAGQRAARECRRAALTRQNGPILFTD